MARIPRTLVGFAVISGFTYALDLTLVWLVHGHLGHPLPLALTIGYGVAFSLNYALNRRFNFRSHAPVGPETVRYVATVAVNFGVILLGVTLLLAELGVPYGAARLAAGACEGVFMYAALRWFVFPRGTDRDDAERDHALAR